MSSIVFVHAHPDDESLTTGGTIARYTSEGAEVCVVICTDGSLGEIADDTNAARLAEVRRKEVEEACRILGVKDLRLLGFKDSGMANTDGNKNPESFINQDLDEVTAKLTEIYRELKPDAVVTYNENGAYGHPDHIRTHQGAVAALDAGADPAYRPDLGPAYEVPNLYYTAFPRSLLIKFRDELRKSDVGIDPDELMPEEFVDILGTPDAQVTTSIEVSDFMDVKFAALEAHRTQRGTTEPFLALPENLKGQMFGTEFYMRVRPITGGPETDLLR